MSGAYPSSGVASKWKQYASGQHDLAADPDGAGRPARLLVALADGSFTELVNVEGNNQPIADVFQGFSHLGATSAVTSTMAFVAYW